VKSGCRIGAHQREPATPGGVRPWWRRLLKLLSHSTARPSQPAIDQKIDVVGRDDQPGSKRMSMAWQQRLGDADNGEDFAVALCGPRVGGAGSSAWGMVP
jgi:hypothetical protein